MSTALVVDGNNLASRAFHGFGRGDESNPTATGFLVMLSSLIDQFYERPSSVTVCFDGDGPLARSEAFSGYKVRKEESLEKRWERAEYKRQLGELIEVLRLGGVSVHQLAHREADDIVATLAERFGSPECKVIMVSNDRDLCQSVTQHVRLLRLGKGTRDFVSWGPQDVFEEFGVWPDEYVRFAAMRGDASDGLAGLSGVGPKKASAIVAAGLDPTSASVAELTDLPGIGMKLAENIVSESDVFLRNIELMTLGDLGDSLLSEAVEVDRQRVLSVGEEFGVPSSAISKIGNIAKGASWRLAS